MWALAIVAGIAASIVAWWLAKCCTRAGWSAMSRVFEFLRLTVLAGTVVIAVGLARHAAAGPLAWQALVILAGALVGQAASLAGQAAFRFLRRARRNRDGAQP